MKAMVLAAGLGTRLRPITERVAKPAIPFFGRPLLARTFEALAALGVTGAIVNTHHRSGDVEEVARTAPFPVELSHEPTILGTGGGIANVRGRLEGEETFLLVNGDVVFDLPIREALAAHLGSDAAGTLLLVANPDPSRYGRIGVRGPFRRPAPHDGRDASLVEVDRILGPAPGGDGFLYTGVAFLRGASLARLPERGPSELVPSLLRPLAAEGRLAGYVARGLWLELGTPADYLGAHLEVLRRVLAGGAEAGRSLSGAIVDSPLRFDRELRSAVHPDSHVLGELHEAVVDMGAAVEEGAVVRRSLLFPGARVAAGRSVADEIVLADGTAVRGVRAR